MKKKVIFLTRNLFFILLLVISIILFITNFVSGPITMNQKHDEEVLDKMMEKNNLTGCDLGIRFVDDQVYYVSKCVAHYVFYDEKGNLLAKKVVKDLPKDSLKFDISNFKISLGFYKNHCVFVLKNETQEILVDYDTYEILRNYFYGRG